MLIWAALDYDWTTALTQNRTLNYQLLKYCSKGVLSRHSLNTLRPRQNGRHFPDDIFKCIFLTENVCISIKISLKFAPKVPINHIPALVLIMAWRRPGDKPSFEPMMLCLLTQICVTRPQWVNTYFWSEMLLLLFKLCFASKCSEVFLFLLLFIMHYFFCFCAVGGICFVLFCYWLPFVRVTCLWH